MTERYPRNTENDERPLDPCELRALTDAHFVLPITEAEVHRAETDGLIFEGELPESLRSFAPEVQPAESLRAVAPDVEPTKSGGSNLVALRAPRVVPLRRAWIGHGVASMVGAAAAAAALILGRAAQQPRTVALGQDPSRVSLPAGSPASSSLFPNAIGPREICPEACCAGVDCSAAKGGLRDCASMRRCVSCVSDSPDGRYRLRMGRLAPSPTGKFLLEKSPGKSLELCVRVAASPLACIKAYASADGDEAWVSLPLTATSADLLAGLTVYLRWSGDEEPMAEWSYPIEANATVLCNGIAVKAKLPDGEPVGSLSIFLDDAYYVELGRGKSVGELEQLIQSLQLGATKPKVFETESQAEDHFVVTLGPMSKAAAESTRWAVMGQGGTAKIALGFDYRGSALRLPVQ